MIFKKEKEIYSQPTTEVLEIMLEQGILNPSGNAGEDDEVDDQGDF